jgi:hydroxymethylglutaryl-CoA reductase
VNKTSRIKEFYKLSRDKRLNLLAEFASLTDQDFGLLSDTCQQFPFADSIIENMVSAFPMSLGIATNFIINGRDHLIPMATEEASVIAAASNAAKLARKTGGFSAISDKSIMIGQVYLTNIPDFKRATSAIEKNKKEILFLANQKDPVLVSLGGGAVDLKFKSLDKILTIWLLVDVKDAMGANIVNTMCEAISPTLEKLSEGEALLKIVSNLSIYRMTRATAVWDKSEIGADIIDKIIQANRIAELDIFRAATHNKGIMNGIDAVCIATGNDFRALDAGCHSYAAINGNYGPLTNYLKDEQGNLVGQIDTPLVVGVVGGAIERNPFAKLCLKILDVKTSQDLANIIASVGLAQNFAALNALVSEGIQKGHMRLHLQK